MKTNTYLYFLIAILAFALLNQSCKRNKVIQNGDVVITDSDGDGVDDLVDNCKDEAGPVENNGCPWPDTDGDGILDKDDDCPDVQGAIANRGCPEVTEEVQKTLNDFGRTILFDSGKSSIKPESFSVLESIISILNEYPGAKFEIGGHTDSSGNAASNQKLSEARANAVKQYFITNGVDANRLTAKGYGETKPIASNSTAEGQAKNRRTEINLIKDN